MSSNKEYHDFLRFLYFEGYVDSYEEAEELVESLSDDEISELCERATRPTRFPKSIETGVRKEEFVIDYLVTEGYTDNYDSAISIYESMSDEWLDAILESTNKKWDEVRKSRSASRPSAGPIRVGRTPILKPSDVQPADPEVIERRKKRKGRLTFDER